MSSTNFNIKQQTTTLLKGGLVQDEIIAINVREYKALLLGTRWYGASELRNSIYIPIDLFIELGQWVYDNGAYAFIQYISNSHQIHIGGVSIDSNGKFYLYGIK